MLSVKRVLQQREDTTGETGKKIQVQALGGLLGHVCFVQECMNWCPSEPMVQLKDFLYCFLALPFPVLSPLLQLSGVGVLLNRTEQNHSVGRDLQRSASPTAWPPQG